MDFYKRINVVCNAIPSGKAATYGQIALLCQKPKNSRQVGYALGHNLAGDVPAHRVVNSQGILSGAPSFETPDMQRLLLEEEGVEVHLTSKGFQLDLKKYGWKNTLDDALWLEAQFKIMDI